MYEGIVKICYYYLKDRKRVEFLNNIGKGTECRYKGEKYLWFADNPYKLYHSLEFKTLDFFSEISKLPTHKKAYQKKCSLDLKELIERDDKDLYQVQVNQIYLDRHEKDIKNFLDNYKILKVQSLMASKKTNVILEIIEQAHKKKQILFITNRITLAEEEYEKFKDYGFKLYLNNDYDIGDHLIVQFDSLWKYDLDAFDIVIIDEITSLLLYVTEPYDGKEKNYKLSLDKFLRLDEYIDKIVLLDAFILDYPFKGKTLGIYNAYRENLNVVEYSDKYTFFSSIIRNSLKDFISFSSNEKRILNKIYKKLKTKYHRNPLLITADTKGTIEKLNKTRKMEEILTKYDSIFYSPVITTGVSFFKKPKIHFHYDNSTSIDPVNSIQMIRRFRNAKIIHYYVEGKVSYKSTSLEAIEHSNKVLDLFKMYDYNGTYLGLTKTGERLLKVIQMKNILQNTHKYAFRELMKYQFKKVTENNFEMEKFQL